MMRAIYIIAEGDTEEEFINNLIAAHFSARYSFLDIRAIKMETSRGHKGGAVTFARYRRNVELLLKQERDVIVTSLIDFYRLSTDFPDFEKSKEQNNVENQVTLLENACAEIISNDRFVPYIQLHEFEALLFSSIKGFNYLNMLNQKKLGQLEAILRQYPNPELINEGSTTAPSKRLESLIPSYRKVLHGNMIALENGFSTILDKCPRFRAWIILLEDKVSN